MANVTTDFKRGFLDYLNDNVGGEVTLLSQLKAFTAARQQQLANGLALIATSGNGHQATFAFPSQYNAVDAAELVSEMRRRYWEAVSWLKGNRSDSCGNSSSSSSEDEMPTDAEIYQEMMAMLQPKREYQNDFFYLRTHRLGRYREGFL